MHQSLPAFQAWKTTRHLRSSVYDRPSPKQHIIQDLCPCCVCFCLLQEMRSQASGASRFMPLLCLLPLAGDEIASFWGIKDNKLFRPLMDGPARYDPVIMRHEHRPNKNSAEWSLLVGLDTHDQWHLQIHMSTCLDAKPRCLSLDALA